MRKPICLRGTLCMSVGISSSLIGNYLLVVLKVLKLPSANCIFQGTEKMVDGSSHIRVRTVEVNNGKEARLSHLSFDEHSSNNSSATSQLLRFERFRKITHTLSHTILRVHYFVSIWWETLQTRDTSKLQQTKYLYSTKLGRENKCVALLSGRLSYISDSPAICSLRK